MRNLAIRAMAGLLLLAACATKEESADTFSDFDTTQSVVAMTDSLPMYVPEIDSARIRDSLRAKEERDAERARQARDSARRVSERAIANRRRY